MDLRPIQIFRCFTWPSKTVSLINFVIYYTCYFYPRGKIGDISCCRRTCPFLHYPLRPVRLALEAGTGVMKRKGAGETKL